MAECGYFFIFQDDGRRHLGFLKFQNFNGRSSQEGRSVIGPNFIKNRLNRSRDMVIFVFFKMAATATFDF